MNEKQKALAARLLQLAADEFSNHGCNDLSDSTFKDWTQEEKQEFINDADAWNGGDVELTPDTINQMPDWMAMEVLAYQLLTK